MTFGHIASIRRPCYRGSSHCIYHLAPAAPESCTIDVADFRFKNGLDARGTIQLQVIMASGLWLRVFAPTGKVLTILVREFCSARRS